VEQRHLSVIDLYPLLKPALPLLDAETGHRLALWALRNGLAPTDKGADDPLLRCRLLGFDLSNPIGLAAGFDKNAVAIDAAQSLGFGLIEIGGVTPRPQAGNPRPRLFRLEEDNAVINRMGFNNLGMVEIARRLALRDRKRGVVGVNLASNSDSTDPATDFDRLVETFTPIADYLTVDISCPNTPNGKVFQQRQPLEGLLARLMSTRARVAQAAGIKPPPMLIKSAPDLTAQERSDIAEVALASGIDGMIVSNTTIARPDSLRSRHVGERGGLSGRPIFDMSTRLLGEMYALTRGRLPLIGVGGIASGADAYAKIRAGASAVQLYSALVFAGPKLVRRIKDELAACLRRDGFASLQDAVGTSMKQAA
jgi:dihydroorotate dehydrogenase